jgi:hypothetical protein
VISLVAGALLGELGKTLNIPHDDLAASDGNETSALPGVLNITGCDTI